MPWLTILWIWGKFHKYLMMISSETNILYLMCFFFSKVREGTGRASTQSKLQQPWQSRWVPVDWNPTTVATVWGFGWSGSGCKGDPYKWKPRECSRSTRFSTKSTTVSTDASGTQILKYFYNQVIIQYDWFKNFSVGDTTKPASPQRDFTTNRTNQPCTSAAHITESRSLCSYA